MLWDSPGRKEGDVLEEFRKTSGGDPQQVTGGRLWEMGLKKEAGLLSSRES